MKKYHASAAFLICAFLALSCSALAQNGVEKPFGTDFYKSLPDNPFFLKEAVFLNNTVYGYLNKTVYQWSPGDPEPVFYAELPPPPQWKNEWLNKPYQNFSSDDQAAIEAAVDFIASGDGAIWGYNTRSGKIGNITPQGIVWAQTAMDTSFMYVEDSFIIRVTPIHSFVEDGKLYIFAENTSPREALNNEAMVLIRFDITNGQYEILPTNNAINLCQYKPGSLLLARQGDASSMILSQMNTATGEITDLPVKIPFPDQSGKDESVNEVGGLCYDAQSDRIFFIMDDNIYCSANNQSFEIAESLQKQLQITYHSMLGWIMPDGRYALKSSEGLSLFNLD